MGNVIKKLVVGIVVGGILFGATNALGFPFVFQALFFGYAMLGALVFMILDFPALKPFGGVKALRLITFGIKNLPADFFRREQIADIIQLGTALLTTLAIQFMAVVTFLNLPLLLAQLGKVATGCRRGRGRRAVPARLLIGGSLGGAKRL